MNKTGAVLIVANTLMVIGAVVYFAALSVPAPVAPAIPTPWVLSIPEIVYLVITATPEPATPAPQSAPYPYPYPYPEPPILPEPPTPTAWKCTDRATVISTQPGQVLTTRAVVFKATIQNAGTCTWAGYRLVALNGPVDVPVNMRSGETGEIEFAIANPPPGLYALDLILILPDGALLLFTDAPGGLLHLEAVVPAPATGGRLRSYPGGGGGGRIYCFGGR